MKNKALISLSFLVLFGVSACSTPIHQPQIASKENSTQPNKAISLPMRVKSNVNPQQRKNYAANLNEQKRLAYNYAWQKKHQQHRNYNSASQDSAKARRNWQQRQAKLSNQARRAQELRKKQQLAAQRTRARAQRQYAAQQMQRQAKRIAAEQIQQQAQQRIQHHRQQSRKPQHYAMLHRIPNTTPRTAPQENIDSLSPSEIRTIGDKIFRNESGGDIDKLVHWNVGENFASMGIGHFTW